MEREQNNYFDLQAMSGAEILKERRFAEESDAVPNPRYYDKITIDPNKMYMASIVWYDISPITSLYIEEIIYEIK